MSYNFVMPYNEIVLSIKTCSALHSTLLLFYYVCKGGYVFVIVCLSVCLLATLHKNFGTDFHEILREDWQWASEQLLNSGGDPD